MNTWDCNHLACEILGVNIFRHLQANRIYNYYRSVLRSKNGVLIKSKYYWQFYSDIRINMEKNSDVTMMLRMFSIILIVRFYL